MNLKFRLNSPLLVSNHHNIFYLTGFKGLADHEREAWVVLTTSNFGPEIRSGPIYLITDGRYFEKIKTRVDIIPKQISFDTPLRKVLNDIISEEKLASLEFEANDLSYDEFTKFSEFLQIKLKPTLDIVADMRVQKKPQEIEAIKKACEVTDQCFAEIAPTIQIGQTERQIAFKIEMWLKQREYDLAFYPIVAVDANGSIPHYDTRSDGSTKVTNNSVILIDFGAKVDSYCSDMTRMVAVGQPSDEFAKAYEVMHKAQEQAVHQLERSTKYSEIDTQTRRMIVDAGYPTYEHSTGHGLGLEIHEAPRISSHSADIKKPGHVITIEPGIYLEGKFGIRIEDTVMIGEDGNPVVLTKTSKELLKII